MTGAPRRPCRRFSPSVLKPLNHHNQQKGRGGTKAAEGHCYANQMAYLIAGFHASPLQKQPSRQRKIRFVSFLYYSTFHTKNQAVEQLDCHSYSCSRSAASSNSRGTGAIKRSRLPFGRVISSAWA